MAEHFEAGTLARLFIGITIWTEVVGVLVIWIKLRRSDLWRGRSKEFRDIDRLAWFVGPVTAAMGVFMAMVVLGSVAGYVLL